MRISDWSSDVCSSDLVAFVRPIHGSDDGLSIETVIDEDMLVALPSGHPLAHRASISLLALSIEPFVLFSRAVGAGLHDEIVAACRVAGFSPRVVQEASQVTSIVNLVARSEEHTSELQSLIPI